jgi:hypothetical protein
MKEPPPGFGGGFDGYFRGVEVIREAMKTSA